MAQGSPFRGYQAFSINPDTGWSADPAIRRPVHETDPDPLPPVEPSAVQRQV